MVHSKWMVYGKKADFKGIAQKYGIDMVLARIIRNRDICGNDSIAMYLNGTLEDMHHPLLLKDADKAVHIIESAIRSHQRIRVIGDYDIDGICSTYIFYRGLTAAGADVDYAVPHRITDGYGINEHLIDNAAKDHIDLIITCDNGISAYDQIAYAKSKGMSVIVTDHHDVPYEDKGEGKEYRIPCADAVVNPKQADCAYPFKQLCGAGVVYKVMRLYYDTFHLDMSEMEDFVEFMAIATIGDIVELVDENRIAVQFGLNHIAHTNNIGLKALINACQLDIENITAYQVGFVLGPCLNASGRLDTATRAVELLLCNDMQKADRMAMDLKHLNDERKELTQQELDHALDMIESGHMEGDKVLVIYLPECHESVAGIIAGRIKEIYYRPTFVLTDSVDGVKGSGRSIEGYNMYEEINRCAYLLLKYGGHPMAAGLSLPKDNIGLLRKTLNENARLTDEDLTAKVWIDVPMPVSYVSMELVEQFKRLEPFGKGNEKPVFADKNLLVLTSELIGKNRNVMRCKLRSADGHIVSAVKFNADDGGIPEAGDSISMIYYPDIHVYNGRSSLQFIIKEWRRDADV